MEITWYGGNCFLLNGQDASLIVDPSGSWQDTADIAVTTTAQHMPLSKNHAAHLFDWPGEYEAKGIAVTIIPLDEIDDTHCVLHVVIDGFKVGILGHIKHELTNEIQNKLGDIDILLLPVGGGDVYNAKTATKMLESIEPKVMIPCLHSDNAAAFSNEAGITFGEAQKSAKFSKANMLPIDRTDYILLKAL